MEDKIIQAAVRARENAYAPYSNFKVGAAVITEDGDIFSGCNIENASYGLTNCAERTAIFKAISAGKKRCSLLAVVADTVNPIVPCGACLQVMQEFKVEKVILCNIAGDKKILCLKELLPYVFNESVLSGDE